MHFCFIWLLKQRPRKSLLSSVKANFYFATLSRKELDDRVRKLKKTSRVKDLVLTSLNDTANLALRADNLLVDKALVRKLDDNERFLLATLSTPGWPLDDATTRTLIELQEELETAFLPSDKNVAEFVKECAPQDQKQEIQDLFITNKLDAPSLRCLQEGLLF